MAASSPGKPLLTDDWILLAVVFYRTVGSPCRVAHARGGGCLAGLALEAVSQSTADVRRDSN